MSSFVLNPIYTSNMYTNRSPSVSQAALKLSKYINSMTDTELLNAIEKGLNIKPNQPIIDTITNR